MKKYLCFIIVFFAAMTISAEKYRIVVKSFEGEYWYGAYTAKAFCGTPFDKITFQPYPADYAMKDLEKDNNSNQAAPLLMSNKGRYVWSDEPFAFEFSGGNLILYSKYEKISPVCAGNCLRDSYLGAMREHFPPTSKTPDPLMFKIPQYNTWIELGKNQNQKGILDYAYKIKENDFPVGVFMIDDIWSKDYGNFEFRPDKFPDPKGMINELHSMGFKIMLWVTPFVSPDSDAFHELDKIKALVLEQETGRPAIIRWWNGYSACIDLSTESGMSWFKGKLKDLQKQYGIDGFKFDAVDFDFYNAESRYYINRDSNTSGTIQAELYSSIGLDFPFNEFRASWKNGNQPLAQRLQDKAMSYDDLKLLIPDMISAGLIGHHYTCPDMIGGGLLSTFENIEKFDQTLMIRSAQLQVLMPMMQFSVAPWRVLDKTHLDIMRNLAKMHYNWGDYIYSLAVKASKEGEPIVRHLEYVFPHQGFSHCNDQYMFGDKYMVTPMVDKGTSRVVKLPSGLWKDDRGNIWKGGRTVEIDVPLERLPYFEYLGSDLPTSIEKEHPYVFADDAKFEEIISTKDPDISLLKDLILRNANLALTQELKTYRNSISEGMGFMRSIQGKILNLSAAYRMTKDTRYSDKVRYLISVLCNIENWGTHHFLDIGEACLAAGVAFDWIYEQFTEQERRILVRNIVEKAFLPAKEQDANIPGSWVKGNFNWNPVCHGGMSVAALAIFNESPEECSIVLNRAGECIPYSIKTYSPDGATPEGPSYWEYGTTFTAFTIDAMKSVLGHCYGLERIEGFMDSGDFRIQLEGTTGMEFGYSDYHKSYVNEPVMMWYARELDRIDLKRNEINKVRSLAENSEKLSRQTVFDLVWWASCSDSVSEENLNFQCWKADGEMPIVFMRTDERHNHAYVGFKGGTANNSHGHQDAGSFVYESQGVRWALDLGTENYNRMRQAKLDLWNYSQNSSRWKAFRTSAESHNLMIVDGQHLLTEGIANDMTFEHDNTHGEAVLDITDLYDSKKIVSAKRSVTLLNNGNLKIIDMFRSRDNFEYTGQWMTDADVEVVGKVVKLFKDGKSVEIKCENIHKIEVDDVNKIPGEQNSENPGVKRIRFMKTVNKDEFSTVSLELTNNSIL